MVLRGRPSRCCWAGSATGSRRSERRERPGGSWIRRALVASFVLAALALAANELVGTSESEVERSHEVEERGRQDRAPGDPADPKVARFLADTLPRGASGSLVAARDGEMVHCEGFGMADREARVAAGCDTVYDVMSMTKQFTAAAILKLEMMGKLAVTDPIGKHIGPVPADKRGITLHQLLTHTSGLVEALGGDYERQTRRAMLAAALASELQARPGAEYAYSNVGYSVLAAIVEQVSGVGYEAVPRAAPVRPGGDDPDRVLLPDWEPDQVAVEYDRTRQAAGQAARPSLGRRRSVLEPARQRRSAVHRARHVPLAASRWTATRSSTSARSTSCSSPTCSRNPAVTPTTATDG